MPFLPLYFQELGVSGVADLAFWSGISLGVTPGITALLAPLWGRVADRYGRKILVERSLVCFVVTMIAMAYVRAPWHVFALRVLQGFFAGYGALALAICKGSLPATARWRWRWRRTRRRRDAWRPQSAPCRRHSASARRSDP